MNSNTKKRRRTEAQLARKRQADRANHKIKRDEAKANMSEMARRIDELEHTVQSLSGQLQSLEKELQTQYQAYYYRFISPATSQYHRFLLVDCRCGLEHFSQSDCLEYTSFSMLLETHQSLADSLLSSVPRLPRSPSIMHIFRPFASTNPVSQVLGSYFQHVRPTDIRTLLALYFLMYRFLRWRVWPDSETYQDIPPWLHPTTSQQIIPHPVCIDFLPWPALREYLITHQNQDSRHSVKLYVDSMRFRWPGDIEFVSVSSQGELALDPQFERGIYNYNNWELSRRWAKMFPHLTNLVNLERESNVLDRSDGL